MNEGCKCNMDAKWCCVRVYHLSGKYSIVKCFAVICCVHLTTRVNGQIVTPNETNSSPSQITAIKGSSVWLHWNYTYIGDGTHKGVISVTTNFIEQIIGFNSTSQPSIQVLAKRIGQNGVLTLHSPIPAPFNGRVEVIPSNSTLVIHDLQYNDSSYQFSSYTKVVLAVGGGLDPHFCNLKPVTTVAVNGIPDFIAPPPTAFDVNENANLQLRVEMDGNPKPSADFKWMHFPNSSTVNVPSVQLYPFVYSSTYSLNEIDACYCGRILQMVVKNSNGSSSVKNTNVTVLLDLDKDFGVQIAKVPAKGCVVVSWNKTEAGACFVKYKVKFKNSPSSYLHDEVGYNIGEVKICNLKVFDYITEVQLTASFRTASKVISLKVPWKPLILPTTRQRAKPAMMAVGSHQWNNIYVAAVLPLIIVLGIFLITLAFFMKRWKKKISDTHQTEPQANDVAEPSYTELKSDSIELKSSYAKLQPLYEEIV